MKRVRQKNVRCILLFCCVVLFFGAQQVFAGPLPGAIFTTLEDGSRVNANIYKKFEDVYLDGGPGQNAPASAAGLPEGDYYFQVTDPSGKHLLSEDPPKCRRFYVNEYGVIADVCEATCLQKVKGKLSEVDCTHATGIDVDHNDVGAITVQLMPYEKTPNKGGVYKVWVTPVERFVGNPELIDNPDFFHGFVPAWSKTDNYKVRRGPPPPVVKVRKFLDANANGVWDEDPCATEISCWYVDVIDQLLVTNRYHTPDEFVATEGLYQLTEETRSGWLQTALGVDWVWAAPEDVNDTVQIYVQASDEIRWVIFGNIPLGSITACKYDDGNANREWDEGEPCVPGFPFKLVGIDVRGDEVNEITTTGEGGCVTFTDLLPGDYNLSEVLPYEDWVPTTDPCVNVVLPVDSNEYNLSYEFGNIRLGSITACKFYDADDSGDDDGEPCVPGIRFELEGDDVREMHIHETNCTGPDGCVTFGDLYPGNYTLTEFLPSENWVPTTSISVELNLPEGQNLIRKFGNYCLIPSTADFDTKGYWHNKNGIDELTDDAAFFDSVLEDVNSLAPYAGPSGYFSKGDEPFNGKYADDSNVPAGKGVLENEDIAGAGTVEAEISNFLINSCGDGGIQEQLAQQLLAFIFNAYYRIGDDLDTMILLPPNGTSVSISELISCAVSAWSGVPDLDCTLNLNVNEMTDLLDWFNKNDSVVFMAISPEPCEFVSMCE